MVRSGQYLKLGIALPVSKHLLIADARVPRPSEEKDDMQIRSLSSVSDELQFYFQKQS